MRRPIAAALLVCATTFAAVPDGVSARAAEAFDAPIEATVTVDAAQILRTMNPRMIGGSNVAMAGNLWFVRNTAKDKPAKGSVYFDHIGFMVR